MKLSPTPTSPRKSATRLFFVLLLIYHVNGRPIAEVDCVAAPYSAWALLRHGSVDLRRYPDVAQTLLENQQARETLDGRVVSIRSFGSTLTALPIVAPFALFREKPFSGSAMLHIGKLVGGLTVAGAAVLLFLLCRRLIPAAAWPTTILFGLGTCMWPVASQALWMHGPAVLFLCLALYLLLPLDDSPGFPVMMLAGLSLGMAVLSRPSAAFFVIATGCTLVIRRRWRAILALGLGGLGPMVLLLAQNHFWFGSLWMGGYQKMVSGRVPTPLWLGAGGLLIAPSRGLFIYSPALILIPMGIWRLYRRDSRQESTAKWLLGTWLLAAVATLLFYGRWYDWRGGWCFGPRLLCETMPIFCIFFGLAYAGLRANLQWTGMTLVGLSLLVQFLGVAGMKNYGNWNRRNPFVNQGRYLFSVKDTQIEAHALGFLKKLGLRK